MNTKINARKNGHAGQNIVRAGAFLLAGLSASVQAGPTIPFNNEGFLTIGYSAQFWGQSRGYTSSTDSGSISQFFLRRDRLTFSGQANDAVGFYAQIEAGNDGKDGSVDKSTYFRDSYVTLDYTDPVRFIVGRFKNTFTRENLEGCLDPLTLDRAEWLAYSPWGGSRDTGVAVWGNMAEGKFQYRFMMANGRQGDNIPNKNLRYTGRVHWSFMDPETDYGYLGTYLGTKTVLTVGLAQDYQGRVAYGDFQSKTLPKDYTASTVDFFYEQPFSTGTYTLSGAVMSYKTGNAINAVSVDPLLPQNTELEGGYLKGAYMLPDKVGIGRLQVFARYEKSMYHLDTGFSDRQWSSAGANFYIDGQKLKVTGEFAKVSFDKQNPNDPSQRDYNQTTVGLQFEF